MTATTNTVKHTPSEWEIDRTEKYYKPCIRRNGVIIAYLPDNTIGLVGGIDSRRLEDEANAHLIAAAPELLAVCEALAQRGAVIATTGLGEQLAAAIAKATAVTR